MKLLALLTIFAASAVLAEDPPLAAFADLQQRPPFVASRRAAAVTTRLSATSLRLSGLVTEQGRAIALIRSDDRKGETRIGAGASLNGWTVLSITVGGLELSAAGQRRHVGLKQAIPPSP
ncbi:MAG TPA: hypothetical protein VKP60_22210 [Magnetospirillaceae bacterium]|nr:hypothetical protein [Magnetospirillaceae bacterium]